jgi:putative ABC transport system substrate-binding protein
VRRREFITLVGGAAAAWPFTASAQQRTMPVVGFLRSTSSADSAGFVAAFRQGLKEEGFVEGQNVVVEYRYADNQVDRMPILVAELLRRSPAVLAGNTIAALAARAATTTVPIVFTTGSDPVKDGLVASLNRPGGNVTGITFLTGILGSKRLELLRQLFPKPIPIAMLSSSITLETVRERLDVEAAARALDQQLIVLDVNSEPDLEAAFAASVQRGAGALLVGTGPLFLSNRDRVAALEARHALPAMYS